MKKILVILGLMASCQLCVTAQDGNPPAVQQFQNAYRTLVMADEARDGQNLTEAVKLYRKALNAYMKLAVKYPDWEPGVVRFRIVYCDNQIEALLKKTDRINAAARLRQPPSRRSEKHGSASLGRPGKRESEDQGPEPDLEGIKAKAKFFLKNGETAKARSVLLEGMCIDPDDSSIRLLMGMAQCQAGKYEDVIYLVKQVIEKDPSNANAHVVLGAAYFGLGRIVDAENEIKRALKLNPALHHAHYNLAQILLATTPLDLDAVRHHYNKARDLGGTPDEKLEALLK